MKTQLQSKAKLWWINTTRWHGRPVPFSLWAPPPPITFLRSPRQASSSLSSSFSACESALCLPSCMLQKRKTARKCKTNRINAARNLINEAWENLSHNTCLHKSSTRGLTKARCCWRTEQRGHTHVIPFGFGATLSIWWVPTERSLAMTGSTLTLHGVEVEEEECTPSLWRERWKIHLASLTHNWRKKCFCFKSKNWNDETALYVWKYGDLQWKEEKKSVHALLSTPRLKLDYMMLMRKRGREA